MNRANRTIKRKDEPEVEKISPHFRYFSLVKFLCLWYTVQTTGQCLLPADDEKTHARVSRYGEHTLYENPLHFPHPLGHAAVQSGVSPHRGTVYPRFPCI